MPANANQTLAPAARLCTLWGSGQLLAQSGLAGKTDYRDGLVARTSTAGCGLDLKLPSVASITFSQEPPSSVLMGGDYFEFSLQSGSVVRGVFPDAWHLLLLGSCEIHGDAYDIMRKGEATLIGVKGRFDPSHLVLDVHAECRRRHAWFEQVTSRHEPIADANVASALAKAILSTRTQVQSPQGQIDKRWTTPDRWPHRDMWLWDSVFHAMGLRHLDLSLARETLAAVFCVQQDDGFIPHQASPDWVSSITQPPLLAFGVEQLAGRHDDHEWLAHCYEPLKRYLAWNENNRDRDGNGLLEWFIEDDSHCRSGESGMDNSPRFDEAIALDAVDFNAFISNEYRAMSSLAAALGYKDDARKYRQQCKNHNALINRYLWCEETSFYHDFDPVLGRISPIYSNAGFLPLLCGAASPRQAEHLVEHLSDPTTFGSPLPVPSVAAASDHARQKDMWRGPVWINLNWLIAHALRDYGYQREADDICRRSVAEMARQYHTYGTFFEFYDAKMEEDAPRLPRKGRNAPEQSPFHQVIHEFGWSATLFIDMVRNTPKNSMQ